jgi:indole-3-glycerol phosphate synthase
MLVLAKAASPPRAFMSAHRRKHAAHEYALIAEIKKHLPPKGLSAGNLIQHCLREPMKRSGAACLSVLTDKPSFQGDLGYMTTARAVTNMPVLRKEFMIDVYQVAEARAHGADVS